MDNCTQGKLNEQRINNMEKWMERLNDSIEKLNENIEKLPEKLKTDISENIDLKIENRIQETENKFFKYIIGLGVGLISSIVYFIADRFIK